jgi:hypothetical protein
MARSSAEAILLGEGFAQMAFSPREVGQSPHSYERKATARCSDDYSNRELKLADLHNIVFTGLNDLGHLYPVIRCATMRLISHYAARKQASPSPSKRKIKRRRRIFTQAKSSGGAERRQARLAGARH